METKNQLPANYEDVLSDQEVIDLFSELEFKPGYVGIVVAILPEKDSKGIFRTQDQREAGAIQSMAENGGLIVGAGIKAVENGIEVGKRGYLSRYGSAVYVMKREEILMHVFEQHFVCVTKPAGDLNEASLYV